MAEAMSALHRLAREAGLQIDWEDASGRPQRVGERSLRQILAALGYDAGDEKAIARSLEKVREEARDCSFVSGDIGRPVALPRTLSHATRAQLVLEDGSTREVLVGQDAEGPQIAGIEQPGYHCLRIADREIRLAIAPKRCFLPEDAASDRRLWGPAVQVPALLDGESRPYGDFGSLRDAASRFGADGADVLAISPAHALFPADPKRFSPYAPSSRLFLNVLLGDPSLVGQPLPPAPKGDLIDWETAIPDRLALLRRAFANCDRDTKQAIAAYRDEGGIELQRHAIFDALHWHFFPTGASGWQDWPEEYHDPAGAAVTCFADEHAEEVEFFLFAQWLAEESLKKAQAAAASAGMAFGLIADLAVGMDAGGSHAWSRPGDLLAGLSVGAPPDLLGPEGQDWGITNFSPAALRRTGFEPFIATLRAALRHAGGIRIDHALGLNRLWVVPHGASSAEGAYLTYPVDDMLRILAIESDRARAIVIGEDLGTVPDGLRARLEERGVLGMRVLWFERDKSGGFLAPDQWDDQAVAMTGTHDLTTVAGWWQGRDIDWNRTLGRVPDDASEEQDRAQRQIERNKLWQAFTASGAADGELPDTRGGAAVAEAALAHVGSAPSTLAIVPIEDIAALVEQPNLPGTTDQHPNWRRRMPETTEDLLADPQVRQRLAKLEETRK